MRLLKYIFAALSLPGLTAVPNLYAYQAGDRLDDAVLARIQLPVHKTAVVSFFASWCHACRVETPKIIDAYRAADPDRTDFVGIDIDKDTAKGRAFQKRLAIPYRIIDDPEQVLVSTFDPVGIPAVYIIRDAKVIAIFPGADHAIDERILQVLEQLK